MVNDARSRQIGAAIVLTKTLSDADVALFSVVMGEAPLMADEPTIPPAPLTNQVAPMALIAALLITAVARHASRPASARLASERLTFVEPAYTEDTLTVTARILAHDASAQATRIAAHCDTGDGRRIAEGEFVLREG